MKKKRFTEEQIISILKEGEAGMPTADLWRKHRVSTASYYTWLSRYAGMEVSEAKKLRDLADENRRLKALVGGIRRPSWKSALDSAIDGTMSCSAATASASTTSASIGSIAWKA